MTASSIWRRIWRYSGSVKSKILSGAFMKIAIRLMAVATGLLAAQIAVAQAPAGSTGQCKDGTYSQAAHKQGACRGHQGVKEWYASTASTAPAAPAAPATAAAPDASPCSPCCPCCQGVGARQIIRLYAAVDACRGRWPGHGLGKYLQQCVSLP